MYLGSFASAADASDAAAAYSPSLSRAAARFARSVADALASDAGTRASAAS